MKNLFIGFILLIGLMGLVVAASFTPQGDIDLRDTYNITGAPYINATIYYGNASQMTGITTSTANSSTYWGTYRVATDLNNLLTLNWANITSKFITAVSGNYIYMTSTTLTLNETKLNETIDDRDSDTTYTAGSNLTLTGTTFALNTTGLTNWLNTVYAGIGTIFDGTWASLTGKPTLLSNFTDNLGNRGYTNLLNFTNGPGYVTNSTMNKTVDYSDIVGEPTSLSEFTDDLGNRGYTSVSNFTNDAGYSNETWVDTYFVRFTELVSQIGNFSAWDKAYSDLIGKPTVLSNFTDNLGNRGYTNNLNFTNGANYWNNTYATFNKTYGDTLYAPISEPKAYNGSLAYNSSLTNYYLKTNPYGFYNSTNPQTETDPKAYNGTLAYNSSLANYYLKSNPYTFWNSTFATFNKTYADTLYSNDTWVDLYFVRFTELVAQVGNWTLDKSSYSTTASLVGLLGNWSKDKSYYWNASTDLDGVIDTDEITELKIDFNTVCAAGSHLYVSGNNLACETDDDTTYTAGNKLYLDSTEFNVNDTEINDSIEAYGYSKTTGTVTSIATTAPISGGTITTTGTISLTACSNEEIYKYNSTSGAWECEADTGGVTNLTNVALTNISETFDLNLNVTGNLTIGNGTTYMDLYYNGTYNLFDTLGYNAFFIDNITADYFLGNGSQLTGITGDNSSWSQTLANSLYAVLGYGDNWNKTYADTLYAIIGYGDSWNKTYADTLYAPVSEPKAYNGTLAYNSSLAYFYLKTNPYGFLNLTTAFNKTQSISNFVNRSLWTSIDNYPSACNGGQYVSQIGDTLSCSVPIAAFNGTLAYNSSLANYRGLTNYTFPTINVSTHFKINTVNITCLNSGCTWYSNATNSCMYWPSGGKDCGA